MAKITTITNPLTGQPAQVDQLDHTAQEIDDAIARALPGGAIDITLQNKAPAGYGLGGSAKLLTSADDLNVVWENGYYSWHISSMPKNIPEIGGLIADVFIMHVCGSGEEAYYQEIIPITNGEAYTCANNNKLVRSRYGNVIKGWEWVNPPMQVGVEYRTTERYLGKPVYRKMVWGGALPNTGYSNVDIASGCIIVQAACYVTSATSASEFTPSTIYDVIPWNDNDDNGINMNAFKNHVNLWCKINRSSSNFVAYLWYIKDTD